MINFFRKTRKKMADDNKPMKYMRYAIGEIALVMVGILLALQVNDWNENRKENKIGINALIKLKKEFIENQNLINVVITLHEKTDYATIRLLELISPYATQHKVDSLGYYINDLIFIPKYSPKKSVLSSLISSGDINFIKNEDIIQKITNWNGQLEEYNYFISMNSSISIDLIIPYTVKNYTMKNFKSTGVYEEWDDHISSEFDLDQNILLTSMEFENLVEQRRLASRGLTIFAKNLKIVQTEIIQLISKELNNQ